MTFEHLRDRLLRAGIAPRHVERYVTELTEHLEDLLAAEQKTGRDPEAARRLALRRLGDPDVLAASAVARKELLSWSHRFPWAMFAVGPLVFLLAFDCAVGLLADLGARFVTQGCRTSHLLAPPAWFDQWFATLVDSALLLPVLLLGWIIVSFALRRRMRPFWPALGLAWVCFFCGYRSFFFEPSSTFAPARVGFHMGFHAPSLPIACLRMLANAALTGTIYLLLSARQRRHA